ncbi:MAG: AAA family ATPase [Planctomycetales bacterium]|nr:AAA family ATPase [Planctomycetales bacterium]MBN8626915.1 AAA family ATPase [Planctomycetota bacterium]
MKLKTVRVKNFKCVKDSTEFGVDPKVTCLVGKNESGKTAILQAVEKLNPLNAAKGKFDGLDYPRSEWSEYQESGRTDDAIVTTWELEDADVSAVQKLVGEGVLPSKELVIKKGYYADWHWTIEVDEAQAFQNFLAAANLHEEERAVLAAAGSFKAAAAQLNAKKAQAKEGAETLSPREQTVLANLARFGKSLRAWEPVTSELFKRLPKMVYFDQYFRMPGQVSLADLEARAEAKDEPGNQVFLALLAMIGHKPEDLKNIGQFETLTAELEAASNRLTRDIFSFWSQNKNLEVQFLFTQGMPNDPPPFNSGQIMRTRIKNLRHGVSTSFDERSTGFVWFFSFLVWFSQVRKHYGDNLVILLDEPGLALHAKAQADLLRYIDKKLSTYQVIYSTHSPFMIDSGNLLRVRTVEDVFLPGQDGDEDQDLGTKVGDQVLSTDSDTLFPLRACLGYEITQTLFVGEHALLVEGPSELLYLPWFSRKLLSLDRTGLDRRWSLTPCGGIDKIPAFLSLFSGQKLHIATLVDYAVGQKKKVEQMLRSKLLQDGHVLTADVYAEQEQADIEDVIGREAYVALVNACYGLQAEKMLSAEKPVDAPMRCVQEAELTVDGFDHFRPAEFLTKQGLDFQVPGLEKALDRFEVLFRDLNALLPKA